MFDESLGLTVLAEHDCDEYEDGQKQFLAQFVAAKPRCGGLPNTKANFDCGKSRVTTPLLARQSRILEGTKPKQPFSSTDDISGKATRSKSKLLAARAEDRMLQACLSTLDHA
ncbi:unnamed protein product [Effrenium voratum]|uniref:Uncharacterized protein n=1 Tax=Effrenium voratum TaxID=2562239 RepID=A0AA36JIK9_9DINO|nr:unnamed protein product [Effrenium voratum]CAJ1431338.1 unnamed protein product [Effrenium voratum]